MINKLVFLAFSTLIFVQCAKEKDPFLIENGQIGKLSRQIQIKQIDSVFALDSIVKLNPKDNVLGTQGEVEVFEKGGKKLMLITPFQDYKPTSLVNHIQIYDGRFKTNKGLSLNSNFKDIKKNYTIKNIETTIGSVVVFLNETEVYLVYDKKELPENLRYNPSLVIEASNIPDDAKIKYFMISWENEDINKTEED